MNFVEFLGFVISLAAMIFLGIKKFYEERQRLKNPEEYAKREKIREENLRKFLQKNNIDFSGEEKPKKRQEIKKFERPSSPPKIPHREKGKTFSYEQHSLQHTLPPADAYEVIRQKNNTRGGLILKTLQSPKDMIIIKEILDKPLSMRSFKEQ